MAAALAWAGSHLIWLLVVLIPRMYALTLALIAFMQGNEVHLESKTPFGLSLRVSKSLPKGTIEEEP